MELTVRPAKPGDYDEIDRLTLKGFKTAHQATDPEPPVAGPLIRSSSYVCTIKGSAFMRSIDALTFVCVKHTMKQGLMESLFGRLPRRGSEPSELADLASNRERSSYNDLIDLTEDRRSSAKSAEVPALTSQGTRRASSGMRKLLHPFSRNDQSASTPEADSPTASSDSQSTTATGGELAAQEPIQQSSKSNQRRYSKTDKDTSFILLAAEASSSRIEQYKSIGTLTGHEVEFGLGAGICNRVRRHEGVEHRLMDRDEISNKEYIDYDPSRGISAYKKPENIRLEASLSPEGYLMARPSPVGDASDFLESPSNNDVPSATREVSADSCEKPTESSFHLFHRRRGSNASSKASNTSRCEYDDCIEERIVGSVTYAPYESGWGIVSEVNDVELRLLSVNPVRGVAGLLIDHCVRIARDELRTAVHVLVNSSNKPAHLLYIRHGFLRNAAKDRFDSNANLSLKCFTYRLNNPRPPTALLPHSEEHRGGEQTVSPARERPVRVSPSGVLPAGVSDEDQPTLAMEEPVQTTLDLQPNGKVSRKGRFRTGMLFNLPSLRRQRLNLYQGLSMEMTQTNAAGVRG